MLIKRLLLISFLFATIMVNAKLPVLTQQSKVVIFTCGPGDELYAGFGHSALWISDPSLGVDRLYNWGTFDFDTPNFYWKFTRGKLDYMLSVTMARRFIAEYDYRKISVFGQTLNLNLEEKQKLFDLVEENLLPENRFYKYDFFYDNCATRIRDIVVKAVDGTVDFNTPDQNWSFREILFPYLKYTPWTKFGINLILGLTSDKVATPDEYIYMPKLMQDEFGNAVITKNGESYNLVEQEQQFLNSKLTFEYNLLHDPALFFGGLFLIIGLMTLYELRSGRYYKWLDLALNIIAVVAGSFLFFMWVGTDHSATNQNLNILWLFPAQALFLISLWFKPTLRKRLVMVSFSIMVLVSLAIYVWPQASELSFLIISLIYTLRYLFHARIAFKE